MTAPANPPTLTDIAADARKAADPDFYLQKATGRALTRLFAAVVFIQVSGVALWLILVFSGVVDASTNLDGFMISQLLIFVSSIVGGIIYTTVHLKKLRRRAEALSPQPLVAVAPHIDPEATAEDHRLHGRAQGHRYQWQQVDGDPPHWHIRLGDTDMPLNWMIASCPLEEIPLDTEHLHLRDDHGLELDADFRFYSATDAGDESWSPSLSDVDLQRLTSLSWIGASASSVHLGELDASPFPTDERAADLQTEDLRDAIDQLRDALDLATSLLSR